jgi:hypothetical protein
MGRPTFSPDAAQTRTLRELDRAHNDWIDAQDRLTAYIQLAQREGIPVEHIVRHAGLAKKTVYRRLASRAQGGLT